MHNDIKTICNTLGDPSVFDGFEKKAKSRIDRPFYQLTIDKNNFNKHEELILKLMDCKDQHYVYWTDNHDLRYMNQKYLQSVRKYIFDDDKKLFTSWEFCYLHDLYCLDIGIKTYHKRYKAKDPITIYEILDSRFYNKMTSWLTEKREFDIDRNKSEKTSHEELWSMRDQVERVQVETERSSFRQSLSITRQIDFMIQENIAEGKIDQAGCGIIVNYNNSILLLKQIKTEFNDDSWTIPWGGLANEICFEDACKNLAIRDLGLKIEVDRLIGTLDLLRYTDIDVLQYNIVSYFKEKPAIIIDQTRFSEYEFIEIDKIKELYLQKSISEAAFQSLLPLLIV